MTSASATGAGAARVAAVSRNTAETRIAVRLALDGSGRANLHTGIGDRKSVV